MVSDTQAYIIHYKHDRVEATVHSYRPYFSATTVLSRYCLRLWIRITILHPNYCPTSSSLTVSLQKKQYINLVMRLNLSFSRNHIFLAALFLRRVKGQSKQGPDEPGCQRGQIKRGGRSVVRGCSLLALSIPHLPNLHASRGLHVPTSATSAFKNVTGNVILRQKVCSEC